MKKYKVLCQFLVTGDAIVEAESVEEAERIAGHQGSPLPKQPWHYVDGSFQVMTKIDATEEIE